MKTVKSGALSTRLHSHDMAKKTTPELCGYKQAELCDKCPIILSQFAVTDIKTRNISQGNYS